MMIIGNEYKRGFKLLMIWTTICCFIISVFVLIFYLSKESGMELILGPILKLVPEYIKNSLGLDDLSMLENYDYYIAYIFRPILILSCFYATKLGISSTSIEEKKGTTSFLYSFPISRFHMIGHKIIGSQLLFLTFCAFIWLFTMGISILAIPTIGITQLALRLALIVLPIFLAGFVYCFIGFLISSKPKTVRSPSLVAFFIVVISIVLNMASQRIPSFEVLSYFSPYSYALPLNIINSGMSSLHYILGLGISLLCIGLILIFQRKRALVS